MIDYRDDIVKLMNATSDTTQSLKQSMIALSLITKIYNDAYGENTPVDEPHKNKKQVESPDNISSNASKKIDENTSSDTHNDEENKSENIEKTPSSDDFDNFLNISDPNNLANNSNKEELTQQPKNTDTAAMKQLADSTKLSKVVLNNRNKQYLSKSIPLIPCIKHIQSVEKKSDDYIVQRRLNGSEAIDSKGNNIQFFNEYLTRSANLEEGSIVSLDRRIDDKGLRKIVKVIAPKKDHRPKENIVEFGPSVVQRDGFGLYVDKDTNKRYLSQFNSAKTRLYFDERVIANFKLKESDLVTLAWYENTPENIKLRWKYAENTHSTLDVKVTKNTSNNQKKLTKQQRKLLKLRKRKEKKSSSGQEYIPKLNFDLQKKRAIIVVADKSLTANLEKVIEAHNGIAKIIETKQPSQAFRAAKESSYVILIQSYIKHSISQFLIDNQNRRYTVSMAKTSGQLAVEKALYRAKYKLNVTDNDQINYPYFD